MSQQSDELTEKEQQVMELVEEALNNEHPTAHLSEYDDPVWVDSLADHIAYRTGKMDDVEEIDMREARDIMVDRLAFRGHLKRVTDDMWLDDKITLPEGASN